jgi:hypothetical protein
LLKNLNLGTVGNSIAGILGGGIGGQLLGLVPGLGGLAAAAGSGSLDIGSIIASVAGGGVGGGVLLAVVGAIKNAMGQK